MTLDIRALLYLFAAAAFIIGLKRLSGPRTARSGNRIAAAGMLVAIVVTLIDQSVEWQWIALGVVLGSAVGALLALRVQMTEMPQLVAAFNGFGGLASALVAGAEFVNFGGGLSTETIVAVILSVLIGALTFTGSFIAYAKLQGILSGAPMTYKGQQIVNSLIVTGIVALGVWAGITQDALPFWVGGGIALVIGVLFVIPIGGADMPVVISMLNSYSGWAACGIGFTLGNFALIITGALVGSSGAILSYIMCKGMNRSFHSVILGGFGGETDAAAAGEDMGDRTVKSGSAADAAFIMENASSVIIVPGYGMAVAQAQHALREMGDLLKNKGVKVRYAIHPVAGRMPGHMNVLLAEANVPYDEVLELDEINRDFPSTDIAFVIGANDVTNPSAKTDPTSAIYGMPILDVERAGTVLFIKRSMASGYAGVENPLFFRDNTMMLFSDAKKMCENIIKALE